MTDIPPSSPATTDPRPRLPTGGPPPGEVGAPPPAAIPTSKAAHVSPAAPASSADAALEGEVLARARGQYDWYDQHAIRARVMYWGIKVVQLVLAASVPVAAGVAAPVGLTGSLGALIVVLEGIQQLFQFHSNWIRYRVTAAALSREINLYKARIAEYSAGEPTALLALRTEDISSGEATTWAKSAQSPPASTG